MVALALAAPIRPGMHEAWRRFIQEIEGRRHGQYEASRQRLGIISEAAWLVETPQGAMALLYLEAEEPLHLLARLVVSESTFDRWFLRQVQELHGLDLAQFNHTLDGDLLFAWQAG